MSQKPNPSQHNRQVDTLEARAATTESEQRLDSFASEVARQIGPIVSEKQRAEVIARVTALVVKREHFSGPIAHPEHLEHYERITPGAADRIIRMAEKEQDLLINLNSSEQSAEHADRRRGMYCGLAAFTVIVIGAVICGAIGQPVLGGSLLAVSVVGSVGLFINGRLKNGSSKSDR